jgi:opacity protein-like surface antigen
MSRRILKHLALTSIASVIALNAYAVGPGFYMGIMGGPATNSASTQYAQIAGSTALTPVTSESTQFGSGLFMGYKMNPYAGIEGGFTYFSTINYDSKNVQTCSSLISRVRDFHVTGKGTVPLGRSFDVFGKAGAALVYQSASQALSPNLPDPCGETTYTTKVSPTMSIGASYDFNQNWVGDISWNRLWAGSPVNNMDLFALSISYHFVDVYCGQFLC